MSTEANRRIERYQHYPTRAQYKEFPRGLLLWDACGDILNGVSLLQQVDEASDPTQRARVDGFLNRSRDSLVQLGIKPDFLTSPTHPIRTSRSPVEYAELIAGQLLGLVTGSIVTRPEFFKSLLECQQTAGVTEGLPPLDSLPDRRYPDTLHNYLLQASLVEHARLILDVDLEGYRSPYPQINIS